MHRIYNFQSYTILMQPMQPIRKKLHQLAEFSKDAEFEDIFVVKFKKPVQPYSNGYRFELRIADSSGELMLKYWGGADVQKVTELYDSIKPDDAVLVKGRVVEYNNQLEISCNDGNLKVLAQGDYDSADFVKKAENSDEMFLELMSIITTIENSEIKQILDAFFKDHEFVDRFKKCPASMYRHHAYIGGLLQHVLAVVKICLKIHQLNPTLDRDLLIAGALLHDIGKFDELKVGAVIRVTKAGTLAGHITLGAQEFEKRTSELKVSENTKLKLLNMILSHHGKLEYGSPKLPATPEAMALYYADELDAKLHQMIYKKQTAMTEDEYLYTKDFGNIFLR